MVRLFCFWVAHRFVKVERCCDDFKVGTEFCLLYLSLLELPQTCNYFVDSDDRSLDHCCKFAMQMVFEDFKGNSAGVRERI